MNLPKPNCQLQDNREAIRWKQVVYFLYQRAILDTCDLWDIWSEWWGDMTWPKKDNDKDKDKDKDKDNDKDKYI